MIYDIGRKAGLLFFVYISSFVKSSDTLLSHCRCLIISILFNKSPVQISVSSINQLLSSFICYRLISAAMKLLLAGLCLILIVETDAQWYQRVKEAAQGAYDMGRAYSDMREANFRNSDKYFHARGNYDAAQRGPGGRWAAEVISDAREAWQGSVSGRGHEDTAADQEANRHGRNGGDPNRYRPDGLPDRY